MAALSADRVTQQRTGDIVSLPIAASVTCYGGAMAVVTATGTVRPAIVDGSAPTCKGLGRFRYQCTALADVTAEVETGIFLWNNDAADPVTVASINTVCFASDDQTVAATSATNTRTPVGIVVSVESAGVWVRMGSWSEL